MKVTIIKRLGGTETGGEPFCDVWVGLTRKKAISKAVECMCDWWRDYCDGEDKDPEKATDEEIFAAYSDYWKSEETVTVEEEEI